MSEAIGAIAPIETSALTQADEVGTPITMGTGAADPTAGFGDIVSQGIDAVNQQLLTSQTDLQALATGSAENLHQIMIRLEQSRISFQLLMQVRGRLLDAYQDVIKMQV